MQYLHKILKSTLSISFFFILSTTGLAAFSDVNSSHPNYDAINYLQQNEIINGYPDGTFKPYNLVNRAEFLKIILEGSNISTVSRNTSNSNGTPFPDIIINSWYEKYVIKAYDESWINGYPDGTFKPEQTINKVEALKILGQVQNWELPTLNENPFTDVPRLAWYAKYVQYAKDNQLLEETGNYLYPDEQMTRAAISEIIYLTMTGESSGQNSNSENSDNSQDPNSSDSTDSPNTPDTPDTTDTPNLSDISQGSISKTFFEGITLDKAFPDTFFKNEVYIFRGEVNSSSYDTVSIIIDPDDNDETNYLTYTGETINRRFEIPVYFNTSGDYQIGILRGDSGSTKITGITVENGLPVNKTASPPPLAKSLKANYEAGKTFFTFNPPDNSFKKLQIYQDNHTVTYYARQDIDEISVNYADFENFTEDEFSFHIEVASISNELPLTITSDFAASDIRTAEAVNHYYTFHDQDVLESDVPDFYSKNSNINFSGNNNEMIKMKGYVITPDGLVETVYLSSTSPQDTYGGSAVIKSDGEFTFIYNPSKDGTQIVEINNKEGIAVLNYPIYLEGNIPLIPDFFDLNQRNNPIQNFNVGTLQQQLLALINESRQEHGLNSITLSSNLSALGQAHVEDMADNNYFSHINPEGKSPDERRVDEGLKTPVSENIARDINIEFAHEGLMRSGAHRDNILDPLHKQVGIGITQENEYILVAQEFASKEITSTDLIAYTDELLDEINSLRQNSGKASITIDQNISTMAGYLNDLLIYDNITLTNEIFEQALSDYNVTGVSQTIGRSYFNWDGILDSFLTDEEDNLKNSAWEKIGISIKIDDNGTLYAIIVLNNP